jgi:hypothetical protein
MTTHTHAPCVLASEQASHPHDERGSAKPSYNRTVPERKEFSDRQLEAVLERLDRLCAEVHTLNRRLELRDELGRITYELNLLNESLQALAYAALGQQGPQVRRRRAG